MNSSARAGGSGLLLIALFGLIAMGGIDAKQLKLTLILPRRFPLAESQSGGHTFGAPL